MHSLLSLILQTYLFIPFSFFSHPSLILLSPIPYPSIITFSPFSRHSHPRFIPLSDHLSNQSHLFPHPYISPLSHPSLTPSHAALIFSHPHLLSTRLQIWFRSNRARLAGLDVFLFKNTTTLPPFPHALPHSSLHLFYPSCSPSLRSPLFVYLPPPSLCFQPLPASTLSQPLPWIEPYLRLLK